MILTGLAVFSVAEVLIPGSSRRFAAVVGNSVAVLLAMSYSQKSERPGLSLCVQVNVMFPPTGTAYPPGTRVPSADRFATTT